MEAGPRRVYPFGEVREQATARRLGAGGGIPRRLPSGGGALLEIASVVEKGRMEKLAVKQRLHEAKLENRDGEIGLRHAIIKGAFMLARQKRELVGGGKLLRERVFRKTKRVNGIPDKVERRVKALRPGANPAAAVRARGYLGLRSEEEEKVQRKTEHKEREEEEKQDEEEEGGGGRRRRKRRGGDGEGGRAREGKGKGKGKGRAGGRGGGAGRRIDGSPILPHPLPVGSGGTVLRRTAALECSGRVGRAPRVLVS